MFLMSFMPNLSNIGVFKQCFIEADIEKKKGNKYWTLNVRHF